MPSRRGLRRRCVDHAGLVVIDSSPDFASEAFVEDLASHLEGLAELSDPGDPRAVDSAAALIRLDDGSLAPAWRPVVLDRRRRRLATVVVASGLDSTDLDRIGGDVAPTLTVTSAGLRFDPADVVAAAAELAIDGVDQRVATAIVDGGDGWPAWISGLLGLAATEGRIDTALSAAQSPAFRRHLVDRALSDEVGDTIEALVQLSHFTEFSAATARVVGGDAFAAGVEHLPGVYRDLAGMFTIVTPMRDELMAREPLRPEVALALEDVLGADGDLLTLCRALIGAGQIPAVRAVLARASVPALNACGQNELLAVLLAVTADVVTPPVLDAALGRVYSNLAMIDEAVAANRRVVENSDPGSPERFEAEAELLATEYRLVQTDEAMDQIRDLRERCAGLEVGPTFATRLREVEARILGQSDDPDEVRQAEALLRQVASEWETQQEPLRAARAIRWLASAPLMHFGHYREGLQALERAVPLSRSQSFDYGLTMASKAAFDGFVGDADALALSSTQARAALEGGGAAWMLGYCEYGAAAIARLEGSVEGVMRHGRRAVDLIGSIYGYTFASVYGPIALMLAELDEPVMARALLDRLHRDLRVGSGEWVERSIAEIAVTAAEGDLDDAKARWRELSKHPLCPVDRHWRIDLFLAKLDPGGGFDRDRILSDAYRLGLGEVALRLWPEIVQADPAPQAPVRIHVLGDLRVTVNGDPVRIPEGHVRDVVSLLMVSNRSANLETVLDRLWPDAGLDDAKRRFKNVMRRMRDLLGDAAVARESNKVFFTDQVSSDLEDFEAAWASALGTQRSDPAAAARAAVTALELYSGPLLSDDPFDERVGRLRVALSDQAEDLLSIVRSSPDSQQRSPAWIAAAEQRVYREV